MVCPKEAIELGPTGAIGRGIVDFPSLKVNNERCVLCGICDVACPFGAFRLMVNGEYKLLIKDLKVFPRLTDIVIYEREKCKLEKGCVEACPVDAISIKNGEWKIDMDKCINPPHHHRLQSRPAYELEENRRIVVGVKMRALTMPLRLLRCSMGR